MNRSRALINSLLNHFPMHIARATIMMEIILSLISVGDVQQRKLAQGSKIKAKNQSIVRRIQRFFAEQAICPHAASGLIASMFSWDEKICFTLDRTNWKFGVFDINFLVVSAIYSNCSIPICWTLLPHQGNSDTASRIALMKRLILVFPVSRIQYLLADREFVGSDWFRYLKCVGIPFCIRLKENVLIYDRRKGGQIKLKDAFRGVTATQSKELHQEVHGIIVRIFGSLCPSGELLILAVSGDEDLFDAFNLYRKRWTIETMFKAFKTAGFNMENTHQKNMDRINKMFILLVISYAWSIKIGIIKNAIEPIKIKNHQRPEFSLFSYGFRTLQSILLKATYLQIKLNKVLQKTLLNKELSPDEANLTVVY